MLSVRYGGDDDDGDHIGDEDMHIPAAGIRPQPINAHVHNPNTLQQLRYGSTEDRSSDAKLRPKLCLYCVGWKPYAP
eukprot:3417803-Amphidinium_carterae.2